jgi:peptidyl-prolyl cis-trans isomerase C
VARRKKMATKKKRWIWAILVPFALASFSCPVAAEEKTPSPQKAAVVNGSVITKKELDREVKAAQRRFGGRGKALTESQLGAIEKDTLDALIQRELLYQESQKKGIEVKEETVNEMFKRRFPDEGQFKKMMGNMDLTEADIKSQFKKGMAIQKLIQKEIGDKLVVSEKEAEAYYERSPELFKEPEQVRASHILIKVDPEAEASQKAEAKKRMEEIQKRLQKGKAFSALAKEFSQCPSNAKGGDLGYFRKGQMVKPFEEAAFSLKPGELSGIVETRFGYHLIKTVDKKAAGTASFEEAKPRIEQALQREKLEEELRRYTEALKEKAEIEIFSDKA